MTQTDQFTAEAAEERLRAHVDSFPFIDQPTFARIKELDLGGYYAFSVMPKSTGRAGEISFLVGENEILGQGMEGGFDKVMGILLSQSDTFPLSMDVFAHFFLRYKVIRTGVVLNTPDGHALLAEGRIPAADFSPPSIEEKEDGFQVGFWMFDLNGLFPAAYSISIARDGKTSFQVQKLD